MKLTELESKVMRVLWHLGGSATVNAVLEAWEETPAPGYTTVLKVLQILEKKRAVRHRRKGRAYVYVSRLSRDESVRGLFHKLTTEFFGGSRLALACSLIEEGQLTEDELAELRELIDQLHTGDTHA